VWLLWQFMHAYGIDHCKCIWCHGPARLPAAPAAMHGRQLHTDGIEGQLSYRSHSANGTKVVTHHHHLVFLQARLHLSSHPPPPPPRKDMSRTARNILHLRSPVWLVGGRCTGERTIVGKPLVDEKKISFYCRFQSFSNVGS
jgi:hypothetical protein